MGNKSFIFNFADVEVREREFTLVKAGVAQAVEPKAFRVLLIFLRHPKKLISKEELLNAVWGDSAVTDNSLTRSIALLRRLLGDDAHSPRFIETVATVGYRWLCPVEQREEPTPVGDPTAPPSVATTAEPAARSATPPLARRRWTWVLFAGTATTLLLAGAYWYLSRPLPPPRITAYTQITHDGRSKDLAATDGSRLYFTLDSPTSIAQVGVNGGEIAQLPIANPEGGGLRDISPDASNALIGTIEGDNSADHQWVVPVLGGAAAKRLEDGGGAAFSPDGGSVIYSTMDGDIFTVRTDGNGKQKLANVGSVALGFTWSPDGKVIRFTKDDGLWEMSRTGAGAHRLLPGWKQSAPQCCGSHGQWTPDGSLFVFPSGGQIWALDERRSLFRQPSSVPIQLTSGPTAWDQPVPGRDGKAIFAVGATLRGELSRIDVKTGSPKPFLGGISAEFVSFSSDGNYVAYVTFPEGILWKANRDGSNRMQLTQPPDHVINPRWSPDSKEIVFTKQGPDGHFSIRRISAVDGAPRWLMSDESADMHDANWSPDGRKAIFGRSAPGPPTTEKRDLRVVDLETRQVTILPGSGGTWSPRWSPDGRYVVAKLGESLPLFDFATQRWRKLPANGDAEFPAFSRDSRFIYFLRYGPDQGVFRIPVAGGKEERVVMIADWHLTGYSGFFMSLDPDDAPLVLRDTGSVDIFALTLEKK
jgi:eukaryotic-like serine/threonine-protein kinase